MKSGRILSRISRGLSITGRSVSRLQKPRSKTSSVSSMTSKKKFPYPVVEVIWLDSEHEAEWNNLSDVLENQEKTLECRSCGYLIHQKEDRIVLATSVGMAKEEDEEQISAYLTIPKVSILSMKGPKKKTQKAQHEKVIEEIV